MYLSTLEIWYLILIQGGPKVSHCQFKKNRIKDCQQDKIST